MGLFNVFSIEFEQAMIFVDRIAAGIVIVVVVVGGDSDFDRYGRTIGGVTDVVVVVVVVDRCDAEEC